MNDEIVSTIQHANAEQVIAGLALNDSIRIRRMERKSHGQAQWIISLAPSKAPPRAAPIVILDKYGLDQGPSKCGA